jgi:hypothetical protein
MCRKASIYRHCESQVFLSHEHETYTEALESSCEFLLPFLDVVDVALLFAYPIERRSLRPLLRERRNALQSPTIEVSSRHHRSAWGSLDETLDACFQRVQIVTGLQRAKQFGCNVARVMSQRSAVFFVVLYLL